MKNKEKLTLIRFIWCLLIMAITFYAVFYYIDYKQRYDYVSAFFLICVFIHYWEKNDKNLGL